MAQQWTIQRQTVRKDIDGNEVTMCPLQWRHGEKYAPVDQTKALLPGQLVTVVKPKDTITADDKLAPRGQERIFLCYFEAHGVMDGSILTVSLKAALTGGKMYLSRTKDFRAPDSISFPLRQARDWQDWLVAAKLWARATPEQLNEEIDNMIVQGKAYRPKINFEMPRQLESKADRSSIWSPEISDDVQDEVPKKAIVADVPAQPVEEAESGGDGAQAETANAEAAESVPEPEVPAQPEDDETKLAGLKLTLEKLKEYAGGFKITGDPVPFRADSKRPRHISPELWAAKTPLQKEACETELASPRI